MKQKLIIPLVLILLGAGWFVWQNAQPASTGQQISATSPSEFAKLIQKPEVFVLDVHIPEQQHLAGTDAFIPYNELEENLAQLPADKNTPIAIYCRSGSMSREASQTLAELGYTQIYDLLGGINAYQAAFGEVSNK